MCSMIGGLPPIHSALRGLEAGDVQPTKRLHSRVLRRGLADRGVHWHPDLRRLPGLGYLPATGRDGLSHSPRRDHTDPLPRQSRLRPVPPPPPHPYPLSHPPCPVPPPH